MKEIQKKERKCKKWFQEKMIEERKKERKNKWTKEIPKKERKWKKWSQEKKEMKERKKEQTGLK